MNISKIMDNLRNIYKIPEGSFKDKIFKAQVHLLTTNISISQDIITVLYKIKGILFLNNSYIILIQILDFYKYYNSYNYKKKKLEDIEKSINDELENTSIKNIFELKSDYINLINSNNDDYITFNVNFLKILEMKDDSLKDYSLKDLLEKKPYICCKIQVSATASGPIHGYISQIKSNYNIYNYSIINISSSISYNKNINSDYIYPIPKHILDKDKINEKEPIHNQCHFISNDDDGDDGEHDNKEIYFIEFSKDILDELIKKSKLYILPYEINLNEESVEIRQELNSVDDNIINFENKITNELEIGVYTFIFLQLENGPIKMYLYKINTIFELGTKHPEMIKRIACNETYCREFKVYYAGEIKIKENQILFNLNSGGFMFNEISVKDFKDGIRLLFNCLENSFSDNYEVLYYNNELINDINTPFTQDEYNDLCSKGALIYKFNDITDCKLFSDEYYRLYYNIDNDEGKTIDNLINEYKENGILIEIDCSQNQIIYEEKEEKEEEEKEEKEEKEEEKEEEEEKTGGLNKRKYILIIKKKLNYKTKLDKKNKKTRKINKRKILLKKFNKIRKSKKNKKTRKINKRKILLKKFNKIRKSKKNKKN
jgi:hypothetical protein